MKHEKIVQCIMGGILLSMSITGCGNDGSNKPQQQIITQEESASTPTIEEQLTAPRYVYFEKENKNYAMDINTGKPFEIDYKVLNQISGYDANTGEEWIYELVSEQQDRVLYAYKVGDKKRTEVDRAFDMSLSKVMDEVSGIEYFAYNKSTFPWVPYQVQASDCMSKIGRIGETRATLNSVNNRNLTSVSIIGDKGYVTTSIGSNLEVTDLMDASRRPSELIDANDIRRINLTGEENEKIIFSPSQVLEKDELIENANKSFLPCCELLLADGDSLYIAAGYVGNGGRVTYSYVYRVSMLTNEITQLYDISLPIVNKKAWVEDGVYIAEYTQEGYTTLVRIPLVAKCQLLEKGGTCVIEVTEDKIYYQKDRENYIAALPIAGDGEEIIYSGEEGGSLKSYKLGDKLVVAETKVDGSKQYVSIDLTTKEETILQNVSFFERALGEVKYVGNKGYVTCSIEGEISAREILEIDLETFEVTTIASGEGTSLQYIEKR